jgi:glucokinase
MAASPAFSALLADVGGTTSRFGLLTGSGGTTRIAQVQSFTNADHAGFVAAVRDYLATQGLANPPASAAIAVACPVVGDEVRFTNQAWAFSIAATRVALGLGRLEVINDFTALALALPQLTDAERLLLKPGEPVPTAPIALVGPGTGLGVGGLVPLPPAHGGGWAPLATEGGHADLAASNEREWRVLRVLAGRFGHVSAERVLSGPGLVNLVQALATIDGATIPEVVPAEVSRRAAAGDPLASEALDLFASWLGACAGDVALTLGARGGVYVGGGVVPKLGGQFRRDLFLARFLAKGRFEAYLQPVPVWLVTHPTAALLGAAAALAAVDPAGGSETRPYRS